MTYNLELTVAVKKRLEQVQERTQAASFTEVVRHALALYDLATERLLDGGNLVIRNKDGKEEVLELPFQR